MRNKKLIVIFCVLMTIALFVVLDSVLFSVQKVTAYCHNDLDNVVMDDGTTLAQKVVSAGKVNMGKSIFLIDKEEIAQNVESKLPGVKVVNIEKKFPDRITIHYASIKPTFSVRTAQGYYVCTNEGKVVDIVSDKPSGLINLIADVGDELRAGDYLDCKNMSTVVAIMDALDRLGYSAENQEERILLLSLIKFIDLTVHDEIIYIGTGSDIVIKVLGISPDNIFKKIHYGMSLYVNYRSNKHQGMITVSDSDVFTWSDASDYN